MPKVLYITEISPFPTWGGDRIRVRYLLQCLDRMGCQTTALVTNKDGFDLSSLPFETVRFVPWRPAGHGFGGSIRKYLQPDPGLLDLIRAELRDGDFDAAFIDCGFFGQYIRLLQAEGLTVVYGTHNAQADLTRQTPARSLLHGVKLRAAARLQRWHEGHFFKAADHVVVVSQEDRDYHAAMMPRDKLVVLPNFLNLDDYQAGGTRDDTVVMTGNFLAYQNRAGAQWLLDQVWTEDLAERAQLVLVGRGSKQFFSGYDGRRGVRVVGEVETVHPYIAAARLALVPLLHGSGTRLKCLEAMALATPVVSTTQGAEGIEHDGAIATADSVAEFRAAIFDLLDNPARRRAQAERGLEVMKARYSSEVAQRILGDLIGVEAPAAVAAE